MSYVSNLSPCPALVADALAQRVTSHVVKRFPYMRGVTPRNAPSQTPGQEVFTFRTTVDLGAGRMVCVVRVVVDADGHILRTISSH